jgi:hypothetical protein
VKALNLESGASLGQVLLAFSVMLVTSGITWGSLFQRVKTLEAEVNQLSDVKTELAVIKSEMSHIKIGRGGDHQLLAVPRAPTYDAIERPVGAPQPRRQK